MQHCQVQPVKIQRAAGWLEHKMGAEEKSKGGEGGRKEGRGGGGTGGADPDIKSRAQGIYYP